MGIGMEIGIAYAKVRSLSKMVVADFFATFQWKRDLKRFNGKETLLFVLTMVVAGLCAKKSPNRFIGFIGFFQRFIRRLFLQKETSNDSLDFLMNPMIRLSFFLQKNRQMDSLDSLYDFQ